MFMTSLCAQAQGKALDYILCVSEKCSKHNIFSPSTYRSKGREKHSLAAYILIYYIIT